MSTRFSTVVAGTEDGPARHWRFLADDDDLQRAAMAELPKKTANRGDVLVRSAGKWTVRPAGYRPANGETVVAEFVGTVPDHAFDLLDRRFGTQKLT